MGGVPQGNLPIAVGNYQPEPVILWPKKLDYSIFNERIYASSILVVTASHLKCMSGPFVAPTPPLDPIFQWGHIPSKRINYYLGKLI